MAPFQFSHLEIDWHSRRLTLAGQFLGVTPGVSAVLWYDTKNVQYQGNVTFPASQGVGGLAVSSDGRATFVTLPGEGAVLSIDDSKATSTQAME